MSSMIRIVRGGRSGRLRIFTDCPKISDFILTKGDNPPINQLPDHLSPSKPRLEIAASAGLAKGSNEMKIVVIQGHVNYQFPS
jgi:hypothetical protein